MIYNYIHIALGLFCALMVIFSINPIHSVLWLVLVFINTSILLISTGSDFLGLLFIIVYVGAIAVLFLFVVMMLNIKIAIREEVSKRGLPIVLSIVVILGYLISTIVKPLSSKVGNINNLDIASSYIEWTHTLHRTSVIEAVGNVLYTNFYDIFIGVGIILLLAMVGSIMLTHRLIRTSRKQDLFSQLERSQNVSLYKIKKFR